MANQIHVERFYIFSAGDPSVGLWDQEWTIGPDFYFEDEEDLNNFKEKLKKAFEYICDGPPEVSTQEEIDAENAEMERISMEVEKAREDFVDEPMTDEELNEAIKKDWSENK
jgi:hypothetical protein